MVDFYNYFAMLWLNGIAKADLSPTFFVNFCKDHSFSFSIPTYNLIYVLTLQIHNFYDFA